MTAAGVYGGAVVVVVEVELSVDLIVTEDILWAEKLVKVTGVEGFVAMCVGVDLIVMIAEGSDAGVESELNLTE